MASALARQIAPFKDLPAELVQQIARYLDQDSLRDLRLTCSALASKSNYVFATHFFEEPRIRFDLEGLKRLCCIARSPRLHSAVKLVEFHAVHVNKAEWNSLKKDWRNFVAALEDSDDDGTSYDDGDQLKKFFEHPAPGFDSDKVERFKEVNQALKEVRIYHKVCLHPRELVNAFDKLNNLGAIRLLDSFSAEQEELINRPRGCRFPLVTPIQPLSGWTIAAILTALAQSTARVFAVEFMDARNVESLSSIHTPPPLRSFPLTKWPEGPFEHIRILSLAFSEEQSEQRAYQHVIGLISAMPALANFLLRIFEPHWKLFVLMPLLAANVYIPKLRCLVIDGAWGMPDDFVKLLRKHKDTLREVQIDDCGINAEKPWLPVLQVLHDELPLLESLSFSKNRHAHGFVEFHWPDHKFYPLWEESSSWSTLFDDERWVIVGHPTPCHGYLLEDVIEEKGFRPALGEMLKYCHEPCRND